MNTHAQVYDPIKGRLLSHTDMQFLNYSREQNWKHRHLIPGRFGRLVRDGVIFHKGGSWSSPEMRAYGGKRIYILPQPDGRLAFLDEDLTFMGFLARLK